MKTYSIKCPDCGATLSVEEDWDYCFCSYCGSKIFVDDERTKRIRITDDAKIKDVEAKERIRIAELEEERKRREDRKSPLNTFVIIIFAIVLLWSIGLLGFSFIRSILAM